MKRATYLLTVRARQGVDDIRALRAWLKIGLRTFGLQCVGITQKKEEKAMDARKYASKYVKPDNVRDGRIETRVVNIYEDEKYSRLVLELESGQQFTLNERNNNVLISAWGADTDGWVGKEITFELATYKDWRSGEEKETVRVHAVSPAQNSSPPAAVRPLPPSRAPLKDDLDDTIPF
jgi:hypothetical protein